MKQKWKIQEDESWDVIFRGKTFHGPMLSCGSKPCLKWHSKGFCWSDCKFKASHRNLPNEDEKKTDEYIKQLCGE